MKRTFSNGFGKRPASLWNALRVWKRDLLYLLKEAGWWPQDGLRNWFRLQWLHLSLWMKDDGDFPGSGGLV